MNKKKFKKKVRKHLGGEDGGWNFRISEVEDLFLATRKLGEATLITEYHAYAARWEIRSINNEGMWLPSAAAGTLKKTVALYKHKNKVAARFSLDVLAYLGREVG